MQKHQHGHAQAQSMRMRANAMRVAGALLLLSATSASAAPLAVHIAYLGAPNSDAYQGALQGASEANAQGKFLGIQYELVAVPDALQALAAGAAAVVVDEPAGELPDIAAALNGIPVINVTAGNDSLREVCGSNLLHAIPSDAMRADAVQQWKRKEPQATVVAQAWHPAFEKYAGAQLNKRYAAAAGRPMSDTAWAGWAAVKLLSAGIAELHSADPTALLDLLQTRLAFDGQKGVDMSFRPSGQLRQPLLIVENGAIVGEAPVRGIVDEEDLDSLGPTECSK